VFRGVLPERLSSERRARGNQVKLTIRRLSDRAGKSRGNRRDLLSSAISGAFEFPETREGEGGRGEGRGDPGGKRFFRAESRRAIERR